jgi:hypothetical protein
MLSIMERVAAPFAFLAYGGDADGQRRGRAAKLLALAITAALAGVAFVAAHQLGRGN